VALDDIEDKGQISGDIRWIAIQDQYFMSSLIPKKSTETSIRMNLRNKGLVENQFVQPLKALAPGARTAVSYFLYFGPKSLKILSGTPYQLDKAIDFGWFTVIAKPCVWLMNQLYRFIPNYGVVIIILTLLIKLLLWPLGNKSYRSMAEMKKLQPLMAEIREKYKDDKKKMNEEMMALYRTYKVNPMGGCLPMALQIPVFIAFYRMLYGAIELRHAPFFGWITDLSAPDRLFRFDFTVPFMQPPYGIPVLTVIMGATMFLQQKMSPPPGDPAQAKMMMLMPVVFTVIFINFPAGLVLYWLVNNIVSIGQQYYVTKKRA
jgi:YidC/Oxa1 family membrane protein insertase